VVVLNGKTPVQMFGCADRKKAKKVLRDTKARTSAREEISAKKDD
jgi:hypothetical protein